MSLLTAFAEADSRRRAYRDASRSTVQKVASGQGGGFYGSMGGSGGGGSGGSDPIAMATGSGLNAFGNSNNSAHAAAQYQAASRDYPYTAIRPIAVKVAGQAIKAGTKKIPTGKRGSGGSGKPGGPGAGSGKPIARIRTKSGGIDMLCCYSLDGTPLPPDERRQAFTNSLAYKSAPEFVRKALADGIDVEDTHPLIEAIENPNPYMVKFALMYCTAFSLKATGDAYWWVDGGAGSKKDDDADGTPERPMTIWYLPKTWVTPIHAPGRPYAKWKVQPLNQVDSFTVDGADMVHFCYPDPADPTRSHSSLQSQAKAVNTDELIQESQRSSMKNSMRPDMVLTAGRLPAPPGQSGEGPRPVLTPEQRKQLISAIQLAYRSTNRHGDPIILDGLIESVTPYRANPVDLDFPAGSGLTKDRIMQGIGTNPIMAGQVEGANRATSYVAEDNFYSVVVNPLITLMSETITKHLGSRGAPAGRKVYIWIEEAKAHDVDVELKQVELLNAAQAITKNELREWANRPPIEGGDELPKPSPEPMGPQGGPGNGGGGRSPSGQGGASGKPSSPPEQGRSNSGGKSGGGTGKRGKDRRGRNLNGQRGGGGGQGRGQGRSPTIR